jgi:hypothetical protein
MLPSAQLKRGVQLMQGEVKEHWKELCEQVAVEQDPKKLTSLVEEVIALLDEKERRLGIRRVSA